MIECGNQPGDSHSTIRRRNVLPQSTLYRGSREGFATTFESQLTVRGQALMRGSTPKATHFEPALFRKFGVKSFSKESYGESVAFGLCANE